MSNKAVTEWRSLYANIYTISLSCTILYAPIYGRMAGDLNHSTVIYLKYNMGRLNNVRGEVRGELRGELGAWLGLRLRVRLRVGVRVW